MKRTICLIATICVLAAGSSWAAPIGTTDPNLFNDHVTWGQLGGPSYTNTFTSQSWISGSNNGQVCSAAPFIILSEGSGWGGNFVLGEALIYNNNSQSDLVIVFDQPQYGVGAYVQSDTLRDFTAHISLYGVGKSLLGSYNAVGYSDLVLGTALFIGMFDTTPTVFSASFSVDSNTEGGYGGNDFALGTLGLRTGNAPEAVPEPSTILLFGAGLAGFAFWRRKQAK